MVFVTHDAVVAAAAKRVIRLRDGLVVGDALNTTGHIDANPSPG
jgi:ABC-type lipoprotein export system ATPase subunit